ncbi:hypothetical protein ES703_32174 [subsurface metagenome]
MSTRLIDHCVPISAGVAFEAPEFECVQANTNSNVFVTVVEITGSGCFYMINSVMSDLSGEIRVTVDGIVTTKSIETTAYAITWNRYAHTAGPFEVLTGRGIGVFFQNNLKVEYRVTTGTTIYTKVRYGVSP